MTRSVVGPILARNHTTNMALTQQSRGLATPLAQEQTQASAFIVRFQGEIVRKSLHLLIALVPNLAAVNLSATIAILVMGTLFYAIAESSRLQGNAIPVVSALTLIA